MKPFEYPRVLHVRAKAPFATKDYPRYKPFLRQEFGGQCVYCRMPDMVHSPDSFGVDHYKPGMPDYSNLFYACNTCNRRKGDFWPTRAQLRSGTFIPNPAAHIMVNHLKYVKSHVTTKSKAGQFTEAHLDLNAPAMIQVREFVINSVELANWHLVRLDGLKVRLEAKISKRPDNAALQNQLFEIDRLAAQAEQVLRAAAAI